MIRFRPAAVLNADGSHAVRECPCPSCRKWRERFVPPAPEQRALRRCAFALAERAAAEWRTALACEGLEAWRSGRAATRDAQGLARRLVRGGGIRILDLDAVRRSVEAE